MARTLHFVVNDEKGASTPDGVFRVFAGLRSDPFFLAWLVASLKKFPNLLQHDNVLCIVIEFDTRRVLDPDKGSLFGVIAETSPMPQPAQSSSDMSPHVSIGSAARNRPTCALTILRWREQTTCATCGISRLRLRLPKNSSPSSASA